MKFHFIGIGGAGMSVIAELLLREGADVAGSDAKASSVTDHLESIGITVYIGHDANHVDPDAIVVVSSAIRDENPELAVARSRGQRVLHRSQALALAAHGRDFVAVAGAHGKTTTSAMLATALASTGADPSWAIGGSIRGLGAGAHLGTGSVFVAEADESDGSFLNYLPRVEVLTNVEPDHLDHYGTREAFEEAFLEFSRCLVAGGLLIVCGDDDGAARLGLAALDEGIRVASYGRNPGLDTRAGTYEGHLLVTNESHDAGRARGRFAWRGEDVDVEMSVVGAYNLLNAAGAWLAARELGADGVEIARALGDFQGTGRRFEERGICEGVTVIDDYAHHPTEVAATLKAARERAGNGRVLALFQPHLYSRTKNFAREFGDALDLADEAVVTGVYAAREDVDPLVEGDLITATMRRGRFVRDKVEAARLVASLARPGDLILTIGAGDVTELGPFILEELAHA
ncbi:UDP-N-acetylmuramate--L-alanine ligase [Arcanobacterium haemolyticum]|nr:UDP-N-acetylmuramate--L-alanine ligase [Arcanobacterium haemolyticum]